jgi:hypothetical protein
MLLHRLSLPTPQKLRRVRARRDPRGDSRVGKLACLGTERLRNMKNTQAPRYCVRCGKARATEVIVKVTKNASITFFLHAKCRREGDPKVKP